MVSAVPITPPPNKSFTLSSRPLGSQTWQVRPVKGRQSSKFIAIFKWALGPEWSPFDPKLAFFPGPSSSGIPGWGQKPGEGHVGQLGWGWESIENIISCFWDSKDQERRENEIQTMRLRHKRLNVWNTCEKQAKTRCLYNKYFFLTIAIVIILH